MHCCISVLGYTASIAFVKPVSPSMQAISISSTPRAFILINTESQNFALSFSPTHIPRTSFCPSILIPIGNVNLTNKDIAHSSLLLHAQNKQFYCIKIKILYSLTFLSGMNTPECSSPLIITLSTLLPAPFTKIFRIVCRYSIL